jgi:homoserine trans-succinylase
MLAAFRQKAVQDRNVDPTVDLPLRGTADERLPHTWHDVAILIFGNWLSYVAAHRSRSAPPRAYASVRARPERDVRP